MWIPILRRWVCDRPASAATSVGRDVRNQSINGRCGPKSKLSFFWYSIFTSGVLSPVMLAQVIRCQWHHGGLVTVAIRTWSQFKSKLYGTIILAYFPSSCWPMYLENWFYIPLIRWFCHNTDLHRHFLDYCVKLKEQSGSLKFHSRA